MVKITGDRPRPPTCDEQIEEMLLNGRNRPRASGSFKMNWHNSEPLLTSRLVDAWFRGECAPDTTATAEFVSTARGVAYDLKARDLERKGYENAEPREHNVTATLIETVFKPADGSGSKNNFVLGAIAEILEIQRLQELGWEVLSGKAALAALEASGRSYKGNGKAWTEHKAEWAGHDVIAVNPDEWAAFEQGDVDTLETLFTEQVKSNTSRHAPTASDKKQADELVWYEHDTDEHELKDPVDPLE